MYQNMLVCAIKHNGSVLREQEDSVYLPFGAEYTIFIKNKNTCRASVRVQIDGVDATNGMSLIINPGASLELERFVSTASLEKGNRFKFIERTEAVEKGPRGIRAEDGLVQIEYAFEKPPRPVTDWFEEKKEYSWLKHVQERGLSGGLQNTMGTAYDSLARGYSLYSNVEAAKFTATGITVPGSISEQKFEKAHIGTLGEKSVMILHLKPVSQEVGPVKVNTKLECSTCGKSSDSWAKFCSECGTSLILF